MLISRRYCIGIKFIIINVGFWCRFLGCRYLYFEVLGGFGIVRKDMVSKSRMVIGLLTEFI